MSFGFASNTSTSEHTGTKEILVQCTAMTGKAASENTIYLSQPQYTYKLHFDAVGEKSLDGFPLHFEVELAGPIHLRHSGKSRLRQFFEEWEGSPFTGDRFNGADYLYRHAFITVSGGSVTSIRPA